MGRRRVGKRSGRRTGIKIGSQRPDSSTFNAGEGVTFDIFGTPMPLEFEKSDISFIQANTPVVSGTLIRSYAIERSMITSSAPYVFKVEDVRGMIAKAEAPIMAALLNRFEQRFADIDIPDIIINIEV